MSDLPAEIREWTELIHTRLPSLAPGDPHTLELARGLLEVQRRHLPHLRNYLEVMGIGPDEPWWRQAAPVALYRRAALFAGSPREVQTTFLSSGTTDPSRRSRAPFSQSGLDLMARAIELGARRFLFPDGKMSRILVLAPPPSLAPSMIMAWGMDHLIRVFGLPGSQFLLGTGGLQPTEIFSELEKASSQGIPVTLIGASFGFVHLLDQAQARGIHLRMAPGSRAMDAGGFKGRSREVNPHDLAHLVDVHLGIPTLVNLLGMTEMASQIYENTLHEPRGRGVKVDQAWTRTVVVDPDTLEGVVGGQVGVLVILDLASVERPCVIRTSDLGREVPGGFEVVGRASGEDTRGCSLSVEDWLASR